MEGHLPCPSPDPLPGFACAIPSAYNALGCLSSFRSLLPCPPSEVVLTALRERAKVTSGFDLWDRQAPSPEMGRTVGGMVVGVGSEEGSAVLSGTSASYLSTLELEVRRPTDARLRLAEQWLPGRDLGAVSTWTAFSGTGRGHQRRGQN